MIKTLIAMKKYIKPEMKLLIGSTILTLIFAILALFEPIATGLIIDAINKEEASRMIFIGILLIIGVTAIRTLLRYGFYIGFEQLSQRIVYGLRKDLYSKLQQLDISYFDNTPNGKIMSKMTGDVEAIRHFYAWISHVSIFHGVVFIMALVSMVVIDPLLTGTLIAIIPFILFLSLRLSKTVKPTFSRIREQFSKLNTVVQENISGNRVVKVFSREPYEIEKFQIENQAFMDRNLESAKIWETYLPLLDGFALLFNVIVLVVGAIFIMNGRMTIGELVMFNRLLWMINNPMRMIGWLINGTQNFVASYEKVSEILDQDIIIKEPKCPIVKEEIQGYVTFDNVSFTYEDLPVLKNISFEVAPGQTVALLGSTGSGKSTLISLLSRFYDVSDGQILIDHEPITRYNLQNLRSNISIAMQDIFLFSDTIEGNISYGVPGATSKKIRLASEIAGVNEFVHQLNDSFDTVIGERGMGLSGGQRQRIALARAIIEDPSILVLDDTTSAVDMETEFKILSELKKINSERTTFIIAHRISSVKDADLILVMDQGEVIERGNHQALLDKKGYYYDVFTSQMGEFDSLNQKEVG